MKILVDTNIIIYAYSPESPYNKKARSFLNRTTDNLFLSCLTVFELFLGINESEKTELKHFLESFQIIDLNSQICEYAAKISQEIKRTSTKKRNDTFIAATALFYNMPILTQNTKDFSQIKDLKIHTL